MKTDTHPDEDLAWYVNGTLDATTRTKVEAHLHECARCRDEIVFLRALRHGIKDTGNAEAPGELGLKRLLRDVHKQGPRRQRAWWQPTLAAAAVIILVQGILLTSLWRPDSSITPLGTKPDGAVLQIQFQPTATEAQIRAILQDADATFVDGPGTLGVYRIRVEQPDLALEQLRNRSNVVKHVAAE